MKYSLLKGNSNVMEENKFFNMRKLPEPGEVLGENGEVLLRAISEEQKDLILSVSYDCSFLKHEFENETYRKYLWEEFMNKNVANYSIFSKKTGEFVGYCGIKNLTKEVPELAIELLKKCRKQGYGYQALSLLMDRFAEITGKTVFRSRVEVDNYASQALHRKLGAIPNGISEFLLHDEDVIRFQNENRNTIDENIRKLAAEFEVEPIELLGHVLEYWIEWGE